MRGVKEVKEVLKREGRAVKEYELSVESQFSFPLDVCSVSVDMYACHLSP